MSKGKDMFIGDNDKYMFIWNYWKHSAKMNSQEKHKL